MSKEHVKFFVGTSGWSYDHWKETFYPEDCPKSRWFEYYCQNFSTVEVNATFYRTFKDQTYHKWRDRAPEQFKYVLKAPRVITHRKYLADAEASIKQFWSSASLLEDKFGLILLQIAPQTPYDLERLRKALLAFDDPKRIAVEFRHVQWFTEETKSLLQETRSIFCLVDSPKADLMRDWVTSDVAYIRLHGREHWYAYDYSQQELQEIADLTKKIVRSGATTVYIFFNNDFEGYAPQNASSLLDLLELSSPQPYR
jgi:uncharacterized protein YecE (DUF72 family)